PFVDLAGERRPIACRPDFHLLFHPMPENPPVALVAPPVRPSVPPHWHAFIPLATPVEKPRPSGQSQLAAAARVGRLRWDEVGELDGLEARWEDPLAHSAVQRTSPAPIASSSHFVPPPSPLPYFFTRLVP